MSNWNPTFFVPRSSDYYGYQYYFRATCESELDAIKSEPDLFKGIILELLDPEKWRKENLLHYEPGHVEELELLGYKHEFREINKLRLFTDNVLRGVERPKDLKIESIDLEHDRHLGAILLSATSCMDDGNFWGHRVYTDLVVSVDGQMPSVETYDKYALRTLITNHSIH